MPKSNNSRINSKCKNQHQTRNQNHHNQKKRQSDNLKLTSVKKQIKEYLETSKSKDKNEKKSIHLGQLINVKIRKLTQRIQLQQRKQTTTKETDKNSKHNWIKIWTKYQQKRK